MSLQAGVHCIDPPCAGDGVPMRLRGVLEQREEARDPAGDPPASHGETTFGEPRDTINVTAAVVHVPADSQGDHIVGEALVGASADEAGSKPAPQSLHR